MPFCSYNCVTFSCFKIDALLLLELSTHAYDFLVSSQGNGFSWRLDKARGFYLLIFHASLAELEWSGEARARKLTNLVTPAAKIIVRHATLASCGKPPTFNQK